MEGREQESSWEGREGEEREGELVFGDLSRPLSRRPASASISLQILKVHSGNW